MKKVDYTSLNYWQRSAYGIEAYKHEKLNVEKLIEHFRVEDVLQICGVPYFEESKLPLLDYHVMVEQKETVPRHLNAFKASLNHVWPIKSEAFSCIVFAHALERAESVDLLLEEAQRVLRPEGILIILNVSLSSLMGVKRLLNLDRNHWCLRLYSNLYLASRLNYHHFNMMDVQADLDYSKSIWRHYLPFESNAFKVIVARKEVAGLMFNPA